jgi:hypothetical protein
MPTPAELAASITAITKDNAAADAGVTASLAAAAQSLTDALTTIERLSDRHAAASTAVTDRLDSVATEVGKLLPAPAWTPQFPGDVKPGTIRWGCSIEGNGDPVARHESIAGTPIGLRRTFWDMGKVDRLVATAKADILAGRLPWVSVKIGLWLSVTDGAIDAALLALFTKLAALPGPVWFTAHHEPEDDIEGTPPEQVGGAAAWRSAQARIRRVLDQSGATNVAFASILMAWTFDPKSNRKPADWWVPGIWDFAGIDVYQDSEAAGAPYTMTGWKNAKAFYDARGCRIAIGEWGNRGTNAVAAAEMSAFRDYCIDNGIPGMSYFDSSLNAATGTWRLTGEPLARFRELMKVPTSIRS